MQMTFYEYFSDRDNFIQEFLKHKNENGICVTTLEEVAKGINRSISAAKNKFNSLNERENVIHYIGADNDTGKDMFVINKERFADTIQGKALLKLVQECVKNPKLLIDYTNTGIVEKLGVTLKDIRTFRTFNWKKCD